MHVFIMVVISIPRVHLKRKIYSIHIHGRVSKKRLKESFKSPHYSFKKTQMIMLFQVIVLR